MGGRHNLGTQEAGEIRPGITPPSQEMPEHPKISQDTREKDTDSSQPKGQLAQELLTVGTFLPGF